jgi:hypothetical protein
MKRAESKLPPNPDIKYSNPISTVIINEIRKLYFIEQKLKK